MRIFSKFKARLSHQGEQGRAVESVVGSWDASLVQNLPSVIDFYSLTMLDSGAEALNANAHGLLHEKVIP